MRLIWLLGMGLAFTFSVGALPNEIETQLTGNPEQPATLENSQLIPPPAPRGRQLYENHCMACHDSVAHIRSARKTKDLSSLRGQVKRWSKELELEWGGSEINDVLMYLNEQYYHF